MAQHTPTCQTPDKIQEKRQFIKNLLHCIIEEAGYEPKSWYDKVSHTVSCTIQKGNKKYEYEIYTENGKLLIYRANTYFALELSDPLLIPKLRGVIDANEPLFSKRLIK